MVNSVEANYGVGYFNLVNYEHENSFLKHMNNYRRKVFHGNYGYYYNRDHNFKKMGFEEYYDIVKMDLEFSGYGALDGEMFEYVLKKIPEDLNKKFYYHIITITTHSPFTDLLKAGIKNPYMEVRNERERNYLHTLKYVDERMSSFIESVKEKRKDTYIFIYGDHTGGADGENYQIKSRIEDKEFTPLVIITPEKKRYKEERKIATFLDFAPTILKVSGTGGIVKTFGNNLLEPEKVSGKIVHNGIWVDREELYEKISKLQSLN